MASADFQKATSGRIGGLQRHLDIKERLERNHSNPDINKSLTEQNYFIGCNNWDDMYSRFKNRTKEVDELHPPTRIKSNRITGIMVECKCPWVIVNEGNERAFFEMFLNHLKENFGEENVHGLTIHRDEVHLYTDKEGNQKMSMIHCHGIVTPYAHWTNKAGLKQEGINGKNWFTRPMLREFNESLNQKCLEQFGYELNTHGLPQHKSVEQLKREGQALEIQKNRDKAVAFADELSKKAQHAQKTLSEAQHELAELKAKENTLNAQLNESRAICNKQKALINSQNEQIESQKALINSQKTKISIANNYIKDCMQIKKVPFAEKVTVNKDVQEWNERIQAEFERKFEKYLQMPDETEETLKKAQNELKKAQEDHAAAIKLREEAQTLLHNQENEITQKAYKLAEKKLSEIGVNTDKFERLKSFIQRFNGGRELLASFERAEKELLNKIKQTFNHDIDR